MTRIDRIVGAALLGVALLLGGGSVLSPAPRLLIELVGAGVLAFHATNGWRAPVDRWTVAAVALILVVLAVPLVQLVPLPPAIWSALPGRADALGILQAEGLAGRWMPISLQPDLTQTSAAYLIPPVAMFVATLHADARTRVQFGWVIVAVTAAGALLGLVQVGGSAALYAYVTAHRGTALGFFANKNHSADLLLIGILLTAGLTRASQQLGMRGPGPLAAAGLIAVLTVALPATYSRAGLLLLPVALVAAALLLTPTSYLRRARRRDWIIAAVSVLVVIAVGVAVATTSGTVARAMDRFGGDPDPRLAFWPDVLTTLHRYQPIGSGLGSFVKIFQRDESLSSLSHTYLNHAHNDVLEIVLEAGWVGALLVAGGLALLVAGAWRGLRRGAWDAFTPALVAGVLAIAIVLAHSLVDYPLRTLALCCTFAFLAGCLGAAPAGVRVSATRSGRSTLAKPRVRG